MYSLDEEIQQEEECFALFAERVSYMEIERRTGLSRTTVQKRIAAAIKRQYTPRKEAAVKRDLLLLDKIIKRGVEILERQDDEMALKAANTLINALKRRAAMLGYDAPQSVLIEGQVELIASVDPRILSAREMLKVESERLPETPPALP
jgi:hypothetical protein